MRPDSETVNDLDTRQRRAAYRAHHRGTKEMDVLFGRYADARLTSFCADDLARFEEFLAMPDPVLQRWLFSGSGYHGSAFEHFVTDMRVFHGLQEKSATQL